MKRCVSLLLGVAAMAAIPAMVWAQPPGYPIIVIPPGKGPFTFPPGFKTDYSKVEMLVKTKLAPNLFVVAGNEGVNPTHPDGSGGGIVVLFGPDGVLLVDSQDRQIADKTLATIRSFTNEPIKILISTHMHSDHVGGNALMAKQGALIFGSENLRYDLLHPQRPDGTPGPAPDMTTIPVVTYRYDPTKVGEPALTFYMNDEIVDVIPIMPSHTGGDSVVRFRNANCVYIQDFYRNFGYPFAQQPSGGTLAGMVEAINLFQKLAGPNTTLVPGHGTMVKREDMLPYAKMVTDVLAKVKSLRDQGKSLKEVIAANLTAPYVKMTMGDTQQSTDRFITEAWDEAKDFPPLVNGQRKMPVHLPSDLR